MSLSQQLAKNTALIALSKFSTQLITFLLLPLYTAILSTGEYGTVDLIISYGMLAAPLVMLNMEMALFRHLIDARDDEDAKKGIITSAIEILALSSIAAIVLFLFAHALFSIPMAGFIMIYLISLSFGGVIMQIARGLGNIKAFAITGIAQGVLSAVLNIIFLIPLKMGPAGMLLGLAIGTLSPALVLAVAIKLPKNIRFSAGSRTMRRGLLKYSLPLIPNSISWWVFGASDRTIISIILGVSANGIYAVSSKFSAILNSMWAVFYMSWSEAASLSINKPDRDVFYSQIANATIRIFGTLAFVGVAATPLAFPFLANADFSEALLYIPILMLGALANVVVGFYSAIYVAKKLTRQVMNTSIAAAAVNIVINLALIYFIGLWAAAVSTIIAYGIMAVYRHNDMKKYVDITYERGVFVKIGVAFVATCFFYYQSSFALNVVGLVSAVAMALLINFKLVSRFFGALQNNRPMPK